MGTLTLEDARRVVRAGIESAREQGAGMTIAVVDASSRLVALERQDSAPWISAEIAPGKARVSAAFRSPSHEREAALAARPLFAQSVIELGGFVIGKGAVPLIRDGVVIGAVGASGGTPDQDLVAAEAGAAALEQG